MNIVVTRSINGDMGLADDDDDSAPMLKLAFYAEFARYFTDAEKELVMGAVTDRMEVIFEDREHGIPKRREAVKATRDKHA